MTHIKKIGALIGMLSLVGTIAGCAADGAPEDTEASKDVPTESTEKALMESEVSFSQSCRNPDVRFVKISENPTRYAATYAEASSCQRQDGSWTGFRSWSGCCIGNVVNNNGNIECAGNC